MSNRPHGREDPRGYGARRDDDRDRDEGRPRGPDVSLDLHLLFIPYEPSELTPNSPSNPASVEEVDVHLPGHIALDPDLMDLEAVHLPLDDLNATPEMHAISPNPIHGEDTLDRDLDGIIVDGIAEMSIIETIAHRGMVLYGDRRPLHTLERIARRVDHDYSPRRIPQPLDYLRGLDLGIRVLDRSIRIEWADLGHRQ